MIEIKNLTLSVPESSQKHEKRLENISLQIAQGATLGILGRSGSGKTSLLRCLAQIEKPSSGEILQEGGRPSIIFQHYNLLKRRTVFENVALPLELKKIPKSEIKRKVSAMLETTGIRERETAYPEELSGGQKQRVAISRALVTEPKVLLADEPTAALDPASTENILTLLERLKEAFGLTLILVSHDTSVMRRLCTEIALLERGRLVEHGPSKSFFTSPKTALGKELFGFNAAAPSNITAREALQRLNTGGFPCSLVTRQEGGEKKFYLELPEQAAKELRPSLEDCTADNQECVSC